MRYCYGKGPLETVQQVRGKLSELVPLGYSSVGRVLVVTYDDLRDDPAKEYSRVLGLLGLATDEGTHFPRANTHQRLIFPVGARPLH